MGKKRAGASKAKTGGVVVFIRDQEGGTIRTKEVKAVWLDRHKQQTNTGRKAIDQLSREVPHF